MGRTLSGIILATIAMYAWGMVYWGFSPIPYTAWKQTTNGDRAAGQALLANFPETGTYYVPGLYNPDEVIEELYEAGPVAFVHVTSREGRPRNEPTVLIKGFVLVLVVVTLIAALLRMAALPSYGRRVGLVVVSGLAAVVMIDLGDVVWWYLPWNWMLMQGLYNLSAWIIAGLILSAFIRPPPLGDV